MNIMELGALGEFVGSIGVIATLAYLAIQIRQNTRSAKAATYSATTDALTRYLQGQSTDDMELLTSLATAPKELKSASFYRGYYLCRVIFRRMEHDYFQYKSGTFVKDTWNAYLSSWREDTFNNPAFRAMWRLQRDYLDPNFVTFMDSVVNEARQRESVHVRNRYEELLEAELRAK